jgi:hypothetical protein
MGKCTFCDISLDYIKIYEPVAANFIVRSNGVIAQTGENGFHFVDEAAPPALMRALALEILRRKLAVTWCNIRFEKVSLNLCLLQSFWLYRRFWRTQNRFGSLIKTN